MSQVLLGINEQKLAAIGLYKRFGFTPSGLHPGRCRSREGTRQNSVLMKLDPR